MPVRQEALLEMGIAEREAIVLFFLFYSSRNPETGKNKHMCYETQPVDGE